MFYTTMQRIRATNWRPGLAFFMLVALGDAIYAACQGRWVWLIQDVAFVTWCTIYMLALYDDATEKYAAREAIREMLCDEERDDLRREASGIRWTFEVCRMEREGKDWLLWNFDRKQRMPLCEGDTFYIGIPAKVMPELEE